MASTRKPATASTSVMASAYTAQQLIDALKLIPHPEGGYFCETYRAGAPPMESKGRTDDRGLTCNAALRGGTDAPPRAAVRNMMTSIFYMLTTESPMQVFACNQSDIVHYWHSGGRLEYTIVHEDGTIEQKILGPNVLEGDVLQLPVAGLTYKAARLLEGEYALLGESVAPGFDYADWVVVSAYQLKARLGDAADAKLLALTRS